MNKMNKPAISFHMPDGRPVYSITNLQKQAYWWGVNSKTLNYPLHSAERCFATSGISNSLVADDYWDGYHYGHEREEFAADCLLPTLVTKEMILDDGLKQRLVSRKALSQACDKKGLFRDPDTVFGSVMSVNTAEHLWATRTPEKLLNYGITVISNTEVGFITDDSVLGWNTLKQYGFRSCTFYRLGTSECDFDSVAEHVLHYYGDLRILQSIEALVDYLNSTPRSVTN